MAVPSAGSILADMIRLAISLLAIAFPTVGVAQSAAPEATQIGFSITKLPSPIYPTIALAAHVFGDVALVIKLKNDGNIDSVEAVSGPPMLRQAAVDSVKQTQFKCSVCDSAITPIRVIYRFELGPTLYCDLTRDSSYPRVTESADIVTIADQPFGTCDPNAMIEKIRVRSARCLFLWKCGWR